MKPKHLDTRIKHCLTLAENSNCPRRKFGAVLLNPERMSVIADGYNGAERGGGDLCGGNFCLRNGAPTDKEMNYYLNDDHPGGAEIKMTMRDGRPSTTVWGGYLHTVLSLDTSVANWSEHYDKMKRRFVEDKIDEFIAKYPPIPSGTQVEQGCIHAEMNALANAGEAGASTRGAWMIVSGEPCLMCARLLIQFGIKKVIVIKGGYVGPNGIAHLRAHKVEVEYKEGPQDPRAAP